MPTTKTISRSEEVYMKVGRATDKFMDCLTDLATNHYTVNYEEKDILTFMIEQDLSIKEIGQIISLKVGDKTFTVEGDCEHIIQRIG